MSLCLEKRGRRLGGGLVGRGRWCSCSLPVAIPGCQRLRRRLEDNKSSWELDAYRTELADNAAVGSGIQSGNWPGKSTENRGGVGKIGGKRGVLLSSSALISLKWIKIRHRCSLPEIPTVASQLALLFFFFFFISPKAEEPSMPFSTIFAHLYLFDVIVLYLPYTCMSPLILFLTHQKTFNKKREREGSQASFDRWHVANIGQPAKCALIVLAISLQLPLSSEF